MKNMTFGKFQEIVFKEMSEFEPDEINLNEIGEIVSACNSEILS